MKPPGSARTPDIPPSAGSDPSPLCPRALCCMSGCRLCWGDMSQSTKVRCRAGDGVWGAGVSGPEEPGSGVGGGAQPPFPPAWLLLHRLSAAPGPQPLTRVCGSCGTIPGYHGATRHLQEVGAAQWGCGRAVPVPGKGMPELGWWPFPASQPSPEHSSPRCSGQTQPGAMGPALLYCSRDNMCQFQQVIISSSSFPAVRLCNSYWSREVQGREHGGPEDMVGFIW